MKTAAQYQHIFSEINTDTLLAEGTNASAEVLQAALDALQRLEADITLDMQILRVQYQARLARAMGGTTGRVLQSNKRRVGGSLRAEEEERIRTERDARLGPYQQVKEAIDTALEKLSALTAR